MLAVVVLTYLVQLSKIYSIVLLLSIPPPPPACCLPFHHSTHCLPHGRNFYHKSEGSSGSYCECDLGDPGVDCGSPPASFSVFTPPVGCTLSTPSTSTSTSGFFCLHLSHSRLLQLSQCWQWSHHDQRWLLRCLRLMLCQRNQLRPYHPPPPPIHLWLLLWMYFIYPASSGGCCCICGIGGGFDLPSTTSTNQQGSSRGYLYQCRQL